MNVSAIGAALLFAATILLPAAARAEGYPMIDVKIDRAKVMRVSRPASMIIIGNPAIADATIKDSQTLIITGKQYGTTNLIVLDVDGEPIADEVLNVQSSLDNQVVVYKGASRTTLACSPNCEPVYRIGDNQETLQNLSSQINVHKSMAAGDEADLRSIE